ncbi:MAG TPA: sigma-70 family RNA polymerase sigma factor [Planctomycetota bacterium]|nr:sigma-70 family RNA polymerase sigma factor [Planctomycetota bacterium]
MSDQAARLTERDLQAHAAWIEGLARALARDEHAAADLVQDTWVAALENPPRSETPLRPWFARVVRNAFLTRRRGERNRREREGLAARADGQGDSSDVLARLESERLLFEALDALEEPLRSTLVARYLGRESAAEISRRTKVPAASVRWRIQRGLERMRALLAERGRERGKPLSALLAPLCPAGLSGPAALFSASISGVFAMQATMKVAAAVLVAAAGLGWWLTRGPDQADPHAVVEAASGAPAAELQTPLAELEASDGQRRDAQTPEIAAPAPVKAAPAVAAPSTDAPAAVEAQLVDRRGRGISGTLGAVVAESETSVDSDGEGHCRLEFDPAADKQLPRHVIARAPNMATRFVEVQLEAGKTVALGELILEPGARASGIVLLPDGRPAVGARVIAAQPSSYQDEAAATRGGPDEQELAPATTSDGEGRFHLEGIPADRLFLWAGMADMRWTHSKLIEFAPLDSVDDVELRLAPLEREDHIAGIVLDPAGEPMPKAQLRYKVSRGGSMNMGNIPVDAQGRFDYRLRVNAPHDLSAKDPDDHFATAAQAQVAPGELQVVLQLGVRRSMIVEAVDASGAAVKNFGANLIDPDGFSMAKRFAEADHADGRLEFELPASGVRLEIRARGFDIVKLGPFDAQTAPQVVRAVLVPLPGIQGRVLVGEKPLAGAKLSLHRLTWPGMSVNHNGFASRLDPSSQAQGESDEDGRFFLTARENGNFVLLAEAPGHARSEVEISDYTKGQGASDVIVAMRTGGILEGQVRVAAGRSPLGIIVAINRGDLHPRTLRVGEDGRFRFENLTPGGFTVRQSQFELTSENGTAMSTREERDEFPTDVQVREGQIAHFDLDLSDDRPCVLRGQLIVDGKPASEWRATFWPDSNGVVNETLPTTVLDREGRFEFSASQPGFRRVHISPPMDTAGQLNLTFRTEVLRGDNRLERNVSTGQIEGQVAPDAPQMYAQGRCDGDLTYFAGIHPDPDGKYLLDKLPAGYVRILARPPENSVDKNWVEIHAFDLAGGEHRVIGTR